MNAGPATVTVGDFTVELAGGGDGDTALVVRSAGRDQPVLATLPGVPFVTAAIGRESVSELAGSFTIEDDTQARCDRQVISRFGLDGGAAVVEGWVDGKGCGPAAYRLVLAADAAGAGADESGAGAPAAGSELDIDLALPRDEQQDPAVDRMALSYQAGEGEHFLGFGTQYSVLDMRGRAVPVWVREQGQGRGLEPLSSTLDALLPGSAGDWYTSYAPLPYFLSSAGRAFSLEDSRYSVFDFTDPDTVRIEEWSTEMRGRLMVASAPLGLIDRFTSHTGRMAPLPDWAGRGAVVRVSGGSQVVRDRVAELRAAGVPLAAVWIEDWEGERETGLGSRLWWNWEPSSQSYPDWPDLVAELRDQGVRTLIYFNPYLADASDEPGATRNMFAEAEAKGYLIERADGQPYLIEQGGFQAGMVDLSNPDARAFLRQPIDEQLALGVSGFMADFGEAVPYDAAVASGEPAAAFHNQYPVEWARLTHDAIHDAGLDGDAIAFHRSGYLGSAGQAGLFWLGDQLVTWDADDGLGTVVPGLISAGLSGFALDHADIGGYESISLGQLQYVRTRELLWRWIELSAFTPFFRTHETPRRDINYQIDSDPETLAHFARFARVYAALAPYRAKLMDQAAATGAPLVRHLALEVPGDPAAWEVSDEFMLGADLLVAPVVEEGATSRQVYLPAGAWESAWTGEAAGQADRGVTVQVEAPPGRPPVFVRPGSQAADLLAAFRP